MALISVDIDEFETWELIDELDNRYLSYDQKLSLVKYLKSEEQQKVSLFLKVINRFTITEFEEMFSETIRMPIPPNQLSLEL